MLDQPGEWYLDRQGHKLYYYPMAGESDIVATIPSLTSLVRIEGDAPKDQFVEYVQFKGLTFSHTTWIMPRDSGAPAMARPISRWMGPCVSRGKTLPFRGL